MVPFNLSRYSPTNGGMIVHVAVGRCVLQELSREITKCHVIVTFMGVEKKVEAENFRNEKDSEIPFVFNVEANIDFQLEKPSEGTNEESSIHGCKIKFQLIGVNAYEREFIMCEAFKPVNISEHSIPKTVDLYDATDAKETAIECGKLTITVYYYPTEKKSDEEFVQDIISQSAQEWNEETKTSGGWLGFFGNSEDSERKNKEFEFLKARRLNWAQKKKATFDNDKETAVGNDPVVKLKEEHGQGKIAMRIIQRRDRLKRGEEYLKRPFVKNPIKDPDRKTVMGVGYSNNFWPDSHEDEGGDDNVDDNDADRCRKPPLPKVPVKRNSESSKVQRAAKAAKGVVGGVSVSTAASKAEDKLKQKKQVKPRQLRLSTSMVLVHNIESGIKSETKDVLKALADDAKKSKTMSGGSFPTAMKAREKEARIKLKRNLHQKENDIRTLQNQILNLKRFSSAKIKKLEERYERAKRAAVADPPSEHQKARIEANPSVHMESVFRFLQPTGNMKKEKEPSASLTASTAATHIKQRYPLRSSKPICQRLHKEDNFGDVFYSKSSRRKSKESDGGDGGTWATVDPKNITTRSARKSNKPKSVEELLKQNRYKKNLMRNGGRSTIHAVGGSRSGAPTRRPANTSKVSRAKSVTMLGETINRQSPPKASKKEFYKEVAAKLAGKDKKESKAASTRMKSKGNIKNIPSSSSSTTPAKDTLDDLNRELDEIYTSLSVSKSTGVKLEDAKIDILNDRVDSILEEVRRTQKKLYSDEDASLDTNLKELTAYMEGSIDEGSINSALDGIEVGGMDMEFTENAYNNNSDHEEFSTSNRDTFESEISH